MMANSSIPLRTQDFDDHHGQSTDGSNPQHQRQGENHAPSSSRRIAWSLNDYKEIMWCVEYGKATGNSNYKSVFNIWRRRNPNIRPNMDPNKLANQKRYIVQNKKLTAEELEEIKKSVQQQIASNHEDEEDNTEGEEDLSIFHTPESSPTRRPLNNLKQEILLKQYETRLIPIEDRRFLRKISKQKVQCFITEANTALQEIMQESGHIDLTELNHLIYSTASVITSKLIVEKENRRPRQNNSGKAKNRLEKKIENYRKELSLLVEYKKENIKRKHMKVKTLLKKKNIKTSEEIDYEIESLKQKISAMAQRNRRFSKRISQYKENKQFQNNQRLFYRNLRNEKIDVSYPPSRESIEEFWGSIYETEETYNKNATWLKKIEQETPERMIWIPITEADIRGGLKKASNWKSPGLDKIPNFWLKHLSVVHRILADKFNDIIGNEAELPHWFTCGITTLIPKGKDTRNPGNYRPITCLPTIYKTFTGVIAEKLNVFFQDHHVMPVEQKGCCRQSAGCKDHLLLSKAILDDCKKRNGNLVQAWIDYKKAFDSVPHDWILKALQVCGVAPEIVRMCKRSMAHWKTKIILRTKEKTLMTRAINIRRGIFQGDSLSPLLFCVSLLPLSKLINEVGHGYKLKGSSVQISHLLYMDDIKLISKNKAELKKQLEMVKKFSQDICMSFGVDKCATMAIWRGRPAEIQDLVVSEGAIKQLHTEEFYRYLGVNEAADIDHCGMKTKLASEYKARVKAIMRTKLNAKNKFAAIGALAVPVLQYSFGIINWTIDEIKKIDMKTRKMLTMYNGLHPMACVERLYISRSQGGRGLLQIERTYKSTIINLSNYIKRRSEVDKVVKLVKEYDEKLSLLGSISKKSEKFICELRIAGELNNSNDTHKVKQQVKQAFNRQAVENWKNKNMYGQYIRDIESQPLYKDGTFRWLKTSGLKIETESLIVAAQDQALRTRYKEKRIYKISVDSRCRICKTAEETITHILSSCPILAQRDYIQRHDKVAILIHYNICKELDIKVTKNWYEHVPKPVQEKTDGSATILWNIPINTDRFIPANKPDIVVKFNGRERKCLIIDIAVPADANVIKKETEKILKYADLKIEIQRMWASKTEVVPIVIGATGAISTKLQSYLSYLPGKHSADMLQKTALLGTSTILRRTFT